MKHTSKSDQPLISNSFVTCYSDYLTISLYYFPFGNKKVYYNNIRSCTLHSTNDIDIFDYKLWGMALTPVWWHCDMRRFKRKYYILLDANQWPLIGLTMDDKDIYDVFNFIQQKLYAKQLTIAYEKSSYNPSKDICQKELEEKKSSENIKNN